MVYTPNLSIGDWIVKKEHLKGIFDLFKSRFPGREVTIEVTIPERNGNIIKRFSNFHEFDQYIKNKRDTKSILIQSSENLIAVNSGKYALVTIDFNYLDARFNIRVEDKEEYKDWADGFYIEMKTLISSFQPNSIALEALKNQEKFKHRDHIVVLDYLSSMEEDRSVSKTVPNVTNMYNPIIQNGLGDNVGGNKISEIEAKEKNWYEKPLGILILTVIAGVIVGGILFYLHLV